MSKKEKKRVSAPRKLNDEENKLMVLIKETEKPLKTVLGHLKGKKTVNNIIIDAAEVASKEFKLTKYKTIKPNDLEKQLIMYQSIYNYFHLISAHVEENDVKELCNDYNFGLAFQLFMLHDFSYSLSESKKCLDKIKDHKDKERKKLVDKLKKVDWEEIYKIIQDPIPKKFSKNMFSRKIAILQKNIMMPEPKKQAVVLRDIYEDWNKDKESPTWWNFVNNAIVNLTKMMMVSTKIAEDDAKNLLLSKFYRISIEELKERMKILKNTTKH